MKILIPVTLNNSIDDNPFVRVLRDGLGSFGHSVVCSKEEFWYNATQYDLIFFQWPDFIFLSNNKELELRDLEENLKSIKISEIKMLVTVHNLHPHNNDPYLTKIYDLIYNSVDAFHHMGDFSYNLFKKKYPKAYHFVVPHPVFFDESIAPLNQLFYKKKYRLPVRKPTILAFGGFRNDEERKMFLDLSRKYYFKCCLWAPKFNRVEGEGRSLLQKILTRLKYRMLGIKMFRGPISDIEVAEMAIASDIIFIQRNDVLNSGNLPLGFFSKSIVVGPNVGNVGSILKNTGNPVFSPYDKHSLYEAMDYSLNMLAQGNELGRMNYEYSKIKWNKTIIAEQMNNNIVKIKKDERH